MKPGKLFDQPRSALLSEVRKGPAAEDTALLSESNTEAHLSDFRDALDQWTAVEIVQRYITGRDPIAIQPSQHVELKQRVGVEFSIHPTEVFVVGSAKLGFSIAPSKRWRMFNNESDLDVAIVSTALYTKIWKELSHLLAMDPLVAWRRKERFQRYHMQGWIRPDLLPKSPALQLADEWFEFFRILTSAGDCGPYKISAGLYYDMHFLEQYQSRAVQLCRAEGEENQGADLGNE